MQLNAFLLMFRGLQQLVARTKYRITIKQIVINARSGAHMHWSFTFYRDSSEIFRFFKQKRNKLWKIRSLAFYVEFLNTFYQLWCDFFVIDPRTH